jgi:hypothetical protein
LEILANNSYDKISTLEFIKLRDSGFIDILDGKFLLILGKLLHRDYNKDSINGMNLKQKRYRFRGGSG